MEDTLQIPVQKTVEEQTVNITHLMKAHGPGYVPTHKQKHKGLIPIWPHKLPGIQNPIPA